MRVAGGALDNRGIRVNDSVAAEHVEEVGDLLRRDVAVELRAGQDARDLRDELWAYNELEALARPRA